MAENVRLSGRPLAPSHELGLCLGKRPDTGDTHYCPFCNDTTQQGSKPTHQSPGNHLAFHCTCIRLEKRPRYTWDTCSTLSAASLPARRRISDAPSGNRVAAMQPCQAARACYRWGKPPEAMPSYCRPGHILEGRCASPRAALLASPSRGGCSAALRLTWTAVDRGVSCT